MKINGIKIVEIEGHVGHFGDGTGAVGYVDEVRECRRIATAVHAILTANKVPNTLYEDKTSKNRTANINHLVNYHNKDKNALIVSYHLNSSSAGKVATPIGTEVFYYDQKAIAQKVNDAIVAAGGFKSRGAKQRKDLGVLVGTYEPAILLEPFFVNSKADVDLYHKNFDKICMAIAKSLAEAIGYSIDEPKEEEKVVTASLKTEPEVAAPRIPHRVQSGTFATEDACKAALDKVHSLGIFKKEYAKIIPTNGRYYFVSGLFSSEQDAKLALEKMKNNKVLSVGYVIREL